MGSKTSIFGDSIISGCQQVLERKRLYSLLDKSLEKLAVYVTAGEGYGKTCAVNSFLRNSNITAVWIPLSEQDNVPWHFWETVIKAVGVYEPSAAKSLEEIGFPESSGQISRCLSVLDIAIPEKKKNVIVADDCHFILNEAIIDFVNRLLAFPHPKATTILISRAEPKLNTMAFLSKGLLARITADDLRFNEEEIAGYFSLRNISLTREETGRIYNDTEGWIAAINHIANEMKNSGTQYSRHLLESGSFRLMEDALFASVPASLQRFLVILSLFEQWPLEAIEKTAAVLPEELPPIEELNENMEYLSSLIHYDAYLHGFRIHKVFLEYLREKQKELSGSEIQMAYGIAAEWCMENNLHIEAASNYEKAGDYKGLLKAAYSFPWLISKHEAAAFLEIINRDKKNTGQDKDENAFLFLQHVTRAGILLNLGHYDEARSILDESIRKYEASPPDALGSSILSACYTALGSLSLIMYRITGDISRTLEFFARGSYYYSRNPFVVWGPRAGINIGSYVNPIGYPSGKGDYELFIKTITQCIPYVSNTMNGYLYGGDSICRAELAFFKGDLDAAEQHAMEAVFRAHEKKQYEIESKGLFYLLRIHLFNGNVSASLETMEQMKAQLDIPEYINRYVIHDIMTGWFYAHVGEMDQVAPWLRNEFEESSLNLLFHNFESMVKAKSLFAEEQYGKALQYLERKEVREGLGSFHLGILEITILEAAVRSRMGDEVSAIKKLEAAHEIALSGFDMPFIELGEDMRVLTGAAMNSGTCAIPRQWLDTIRNRASVYAKKLTTVKEYFRKGREESCVPFLTSQELSILAGISRGSTREEIAKEYSLSINTVKNIIKIIYNKLGAINRADAIRIATKMDIL